MVLLRRLAHETGGQFWQVADIESLPQAVGKLSVAMRSLYVLYYSSTRPANDGSYRRIPVKVTPLAGASPRLRVVWATMRLIGRLSSQMAGRFARLIGSVHCAFLVPACLALPDRSVALQQHRMVVMAAL